MTNVCPLPGLAVLKPVFPEGRLKPVSQNNEIGGGKERQTLLLNIILRSENGRALSREPLRVNTPPANFLVQQKLCLISVNNYTTTYCDLNKFNGKIKITPEFNLKM